jgi:hypothetical protein
MIMLLIVVAALPLIIVGMALQAHPPDEVGEDLG